MQVASGKRSFAVNNFDLIRLVAAFQVVLTHSLEHFGIALPESFGWVKWIPGVPIFFFISGFLISRSYENNPAIRDYARNRALRIYPALVVCTLLSLLIVKLTGYLDTVEFSTGRFVAWVLGQITIVQFYNPEFMRNFGTGVFNGSLWTITVELQFYVLTPILYRVARLKHSKSSGNFRLLSLTLFFLLVSAAFQISRPMWGEATWHKLWMVSFSPWFYMFLVGVLFQRRHSFFLRILNDRFVLCLTIYATAVIVGTRFLGWHLGNGLSPPIFFLLAPTVFSAAYSFPDIGALLLRRQDVSYGAYIYHMPVINVMLYYGFKGKVWWLGVMFVATFTLAALSWRLVERPFLKRKRHALNPVRTEPT